MPENEKTIVHTSNAGGAGWFVAVLLLLLIAAGVYYVANNGFTGQKSVNIELKVPDPSGNSG